MIPPIVHATLLPSIAGSDPLPIFVYCMAETAVDAKIKNIKANDIERSFLSITLASPTSKFPKLIRHLQIPNFLALF
jgi:hypothetical protein